MSERRKAEGSSPETALASTRMWAPVPGLSRREFELLARLIKAHVGIDLGPSKVALLEARLSSRLRILGLRSFGEYIARLEQDPGGPELIALLDAVTTNITSFFRQPDHFTYLRDTLVPRWAAGRRGKSKRLRIWSAACSTGEESYSIAMELLGTMPDLVTWDAKILATDISTAALERARRGSYDLSSLDELPAQLDERFVTRSQVAAQIQPKVRDLVTFARLNLMGEWTLRGPFDAIFCRNVMIYFDTLTRQRLVGRLRDLLVPGGTLFIGHAERLHGVHQGFRSDGPAVYTKT